MGFIAVDLGTTNIKVAYYTDDLVELGIKSVQFKYIKEKDKVEFDAVLYFNTVCTAISKCLMDLPDNIDEEHQIILTGQAESLVVINNNDEPVRNGISWLDTRSQVQCDELEKVFDSDTSYGITGQNSISPTWPITKILWIKHNEPQIFNSNVRYLLLKDYIAYRLTGVLAGEYSIYNFSYYFNVTTKKYWEEILDYCDVKISQLPDLVEPGTIIGKLKGEIRSQLGIVKECYVNIGALDHFAGMIGSGNINTKRIYESTGTVLSIGSFIDKPVFSDAKTPCHYGPFKDTYVVLNVCESGGFSIEWYKNVFMKDFTYKEMDLVIKSRDIDPELIFLPYLKGINAPEYNNRANGVFYGIQDYHDSFDFAIAVMEGVAHLLKKNISSFSRIGIDPDEIISTGGGSKSDFWSHLKANISGKPVVVMDVNESACFGSAIMGSVSRGFFDSYEDAINGKIKVGKTFIPKKSDFFLEKHNLFNSVYDRLFASGKT